MFTSRKFLFVALLSLLAFPSAVVAQTGRITGIVRDADTGSPLPGANVVIAGTSQGAASDLDGAFTIPNVASGPLTIVVSYIGYERQEVEVEVTPGQDVRVEIEMTWAGVEGEEIVITAQARGQTQAINEQLSARTIVNVVSSERIRELPDESAATAISRLPGVSLQDGDKVVVRGIQAKLNTVLVNGIQLPSTSLEDRSTNLGFISSNMLAGIEVTKAVTPAMDANSIGGVVNLRLREAPDGFHYDTMLQGDYNEQDRTYNNYLAWASASNRFFGGRLGAFLQGNARRLDGGQDVGNVVFLEMGPGQDVYGGRTYGMSEFEFSDQININQEYGASLMLDYRLPGNGKILLQNTYASEIADLATNTDRLFLQTRRRGFRLERDINNRYLLINALQGDHYIGPVRVDWGLSHARSQKDTDLRYSIEFNPTTPGAWEDSFTEEQLMRFTPDSIFAIVLDPERSINTSSGNGATRDEHFTERRLNALLNVTVPVTLSNWLSGSLQAGGKIEQLSRTNDITRYFARLSEPSNNELAADFIRSIGGDPNVALQFPVFREADYSRGKYFLGGQRTMSDVVSLDYMDEYMRLAPPGWGLPHASDSRRSDYEADESLSAGYIMADMNLGRRLKVLTGVRYEHFSMDYEAPFVFQTHFDGAGGVPDTLTADRTMDHWFPNLQLRFAATDWFDIRLAYTKTLSRPDYRQLLPSTFVNLDGQTGEAGNPFLNPTVSQNYDAYLSFYNNKIGLFTIGGFIKRLEDVILQQSIIRRNLDQYPGVYWVPSMRPDEGFPDLRPERFVTTFLNNIYPAHLRGIEVDWQTNFWYLPRPFNSLVLNINYTRVHSEMDYHQIRTERRGDPLSGFEFIQNDTLRTARLLQQGDNVLNTALGVDIGGFSGRISFRFQGDVITNVGNRPEEDAFTENVYAWDFSIRQALPLPGLTLFLNGVNIGHTPVNSYRYFPVTRGGESIDHVSRLSYNPRRFQLGIRYTY